MGKEGYPKQRICLRKLFYRLTAIFTFTNRISLNSTLTWYIKTIYFPDGAVLKTSRSQRGGPGFDPRPGN